MPRPDQEAGRREYRLEAKAAQAQGWPAEPIFAIQIAGDAAEQCCFMMDNHGEAIIVDTLHSMRRPLSQAHRKNSLMQPNK